MKSLLLFWCMIQIFAPHQESITLDAKATIFKAYCTNDRDAWTTGLASLNEAWEAHPEEGKYLFDLIQSEYGYIGYRLSIDEDGVDDDIERLIDLTKELGEFEDYRSHSEAYRGAFFALKIGIKPIRALSLGPKSEKALKRAVEINPNNPQAWVEMGNMRYHAPGLFGGSAAKAIECFSIAIDLYDQDPGLRENNWQYLHAICWMGLAYEVEDDYESAKECYKKALRFAPDFFWAKEELLPDVEKKLK